MTLFDAEVVGLKIQSEYENDVEFFRWVLSHDIDNFCEFKDEDMEVLFHLGVVMNVMYKEGQKSIITENTVKTCNEAK